MSDDKTIDLITYKKSIEPKTLDQTYKEGLDHLFEKLQEESKNIESIICITVSKNESGYRIWSQFKSEDTWKLLGILEDHKQDILIANKMYEEYEE